MVPIVLLALVAGFLAVRLYTMLGKRTGHEQTIAPVEERSVRTAAAVETARAAPAAPVDAGLDEAAATGVRALAGADPSFDVARFLEGAREAYRLILEAYWAGELGRLEGLVAEDVRRAFADAVAARTTAGHRLDNRLVAVERARISEARVDGRQAFVTVRFDADIATVTRDAEERVVAGSMSDAVPTVDIWTFARTLRADDPNWMLVETDESR